MVGSPNFVRFVYDGDGSATGTAGPPGSGKIERFFLNYFENQGLATDPTPFDGRSDYGPFIDRGIPAGGLFTGAEGMKTAEEAAVYGGTAGEPYDPCYHQLCDQYPDNLNVTALDQMSDAIAHVAFRFANEDPVVADWMGRDGGGRRGRPPRFFWVTGQFAITGVPWRVVP